MATNPAWHVELDGIDEATVKLMLDLHLQDVEDLKASSTESEQAALRIYEAQLHAERAIRASIGDYVNEPIKSGNLEEQPAAPEDDTATTVPKGHVPTFKCVVCNDDFDSLHCYEVPCGHTYCDSDLETLFRQCLTDLSLYPPRCCRQEIPFDDVRLFLSKGLTHDFEAKREELDDIKPTYCHVPTCSTYLGAKDKTGVVGTCPSCASKTCLECKEALHDGDCSYDAAVRETLQLAENEGWRRCPGCERMVELESGCYHITCLCRTEFCYLCGERWKNCACPQFEEARLLQRAEEIALREDQDVDHVMDNLRVNHDCVEHRWTRVTGRHRCDNCHHHLREFIFRCRTCRAQNCVRCRFNRW